MANARQEQKLAQLKELLDNGDISQKTYDKAVKLEKLYQPWIFKKNAKGKITGVNDIFGNMEKERNAKAKKKSKKSSK